MPAVAMGIAQLLPLFLSLFGGGRQRDVGEQFNLLMSLFGPQFAPIRQAMIQQGGLQGARIGQAVSRRIGEAGGGATGIGTIGRSAAQGTQSIATGQANLMSQQALLSLVAQALGQPSTVRPPSGFQQFQSALGLSTLGGQNPFVGAIEQFGKLFPKKAALPEPGPFFP